MKKLVCMAICPELDCDNHAHCIDTEEGIREKEERTGDYCPCGNTPVWEEMTQEEDMDFDDGIHHFDSDPWFYVDDFPWDEHDNLEEVVCYLDGKPLTKYDIECMNL